MLKEAKKALRISTAMYDDELASLMAAGAHDLEIAGVILPGSVDFTVGTDDAVTDNSDLTDPLVLRAILTYVRMHFGSPPDYQQLRDSYDLQKCQLMHADGYTEYGAGDQA